MLEAVIVIGVLVCITVVFAIGKFVVHRIQQDNENEERRRNRKERLNRLEKIKRYPVCQLTEQELEAIRQVDVPPGFLDECPLGTRFLCLDTDYLHPDFYVMGEVVSGENLIAAQWGAGLCPPARGINRYRVEVV